MMIVRNLLLAFLCCPLAPPASAFAESIQAAAAHKPPAAIESADPRNPPAAIEPAGPLSLPVAIEAALQGNPALAVSQAEIGVREGKLLQAGLRPNPTANAEFEDFAGTGSRKGLKSGEATQSISQLFELGSKRANRIRSADLQRDVAAAIHAAVLRDVLADVRKAFADALISQERVELARELLKITQASVQTVASTVKAGAVSPVEEHRAASTVARARAELFAAEESYAIARSNLAASWGSNTPKFGRVEGRLEPLAKPPELGQLLEQAGTSPEVARYDVEIAQRRAALDLERSKAAPDLTLTAGVREYSDDSDAAFVFGFSVPIPFFDRNQGNILAATREVSKTTLEWRAANVSVRQRLREAHIVMSASFDRAAALRDEAIPAARRAYEGALNAYLQGLFRYVEVLDAQRTLFEVRRSYLDALDAYHRAAADLARWEAASSPAAPHLEVQP
jgi:cobalt-zinc-cadmium efflux system outer membrane protein